MTQHRNIGRLLGLSATMALMMGFSANIASAAPIRPATALPAAAADVQSRTDIVQQVQFGKRGLRGGRGIVGNRGLRIGRGNRGYRWAGRRRGPGWIAPAIIGSAIIGGAIAASRSNHGGRWQQCADTYRSFDWDDGTYQPYGGGPRELCPYLRG